ncbi:SDR family oxidoreductase [Paenibacillus faecalis]|uniref:SDR family oxidoreductase n=1 Tax=Paenibacillus faecalis TaxID=2079532 RepID=UPI000D0EE210|nr:SDR family oxidoreductase [Paenibacillus faecalis]
MKTVFVAGANGRTGEKITKLLAKDGYEVICLIRQEAPQPDFQVTGVKSVSGDLNGNISDCLKGVDAVICAAGAGIDDDPEEVDHVGTVRLIEQCVIEGIQRFIMISSMGTNHQSSIPDLKPTLIAKQKTETILEESTLVHTIIRPGRLTDDKPTGLVEAARHLKHFGEISRDDVARAAVLSLTMPEMENESFDLIQGDIPIEQALLRITSVNSSTVFDE